MPTNPEMKNELIVVCGAGGFIGGHLVADMLRQGYTRIRAVDLKPLDRWYQRFEEVENLSLNLMELHTCETAVKDATWVYNLAADMGGMGFIEKNKAPIQRCLKMAMVGKSCSPNACAGIFPRILD